MATLARMPDRDKPSRWPGSASENRMHASEDVKKPIDIDGLLPSLIDQPL
jgi:hypothetical protein